MNKVDLKKTVIPKSDQLNADDLIEPKTICIRDVKAGSDETQPVNIYYYGDNNKPYKPCKTVRRILIQLWGSEGTEFINRKLTLYRDDSVKWGGVEVGGIRVSHASHINEPKKVLVTMAKNSRRPVTIYPLIGKKITDIEGAKTAIKEGKYTLEQILATYDLSDEQLRELTS